jgi:hypothetical protein
LGVGSHRTTEKQSKANVAARNFMPARLENTSATK